MLSELTLNTVKYGLADRERVTITLRGQLGEAGLEFEFRDDGPGFPDHVLHGADRHGGAELVRELVCQSLRGELELGNDNGAVTRIRFPLR